MPSPLVSLSTLNLYKKSKQMEGKPVCVGKSLSVVVNVCLVLFCTWLTYFTTYQISFPQFSYLGLHIIISTVQFCLYVSTCGKESNTALNVEPFQLLQSCPQDVLFGILLEAIHSLISFFKASAEKEENDYEIPTQNDKNKHLLKKITIRKKRTKLPKEW